MLYPQLRNFLLSVTGILMSFILMAQPVEQPVKIVIKQSGNQWEYAVGKKISFSIEVFCNGFLLNGATVNVKVGPERMPPFLIDSFTTQENKYTTPELTMTTPGFLRCIATTVWNGNTYRGISTIGFEPTHIQPASEKPRDFEIFWDGVKNELSKVPINPMMVLLPEKSTASVNVYHVNIQNIGQSKIYGMLAIPKLPGKYPSILQLPGAGIRPYLPDVSLAEKGIIVFTIGIHGLPVNLDPTLYKDLEQGALKGYFYFNLHDKDKYYYKRVYAGCIRAIDFLFTLPEFDQKKLAVTGNSQGGALSIITGSLDKRVTCLGVIHPALSDLNGYNLKRAGGWPHMMDPLNNWNPGQQSFLDNLSYYDVTHFASLLKVPGFYTWGYNDESCPPTSMYAAYNVINAPKLISLWHETGHWFYPEQKIALNDFILKSLKASDK
jgi:cephalosporin-C deacetylase